MLEFSVNKVIDAITKRKLLLDTLLTVQAKTKHAILVSQINTATVSCKSYKLFMKVSKSLRL